jgi:hypothetical protein
MRRRVSTLVASLMAASAPLAGAQTDVILEVGASQIGPPVGSGAESARFGVGGVRVSHYALAGSGISASLLAGRTIGDQNGGDFLSATVSSSMVEDWGRGWAGGMDLRLFGFGIRAPFPYRAIAAEGGPMIQYGRGSLSVKGAAVAGVGRSRIELWRVAGGPTRVFEHDLWRVGAVAEVMLGSGPLRAGVTGGAHETRGGVFGSGGGRVVFAGGWGAVEVSADVWRTPLGSEATGGLVFVVPLSGWSLRGFLGRSQPDPLTLAEPGSGSGGFLVGRSLYSRQPTEPTTTAGPRRIALTPQGARVRLSVQPPAGTVRVEVLGDFTLWESVPMERGSDGWSVELDVPVGTHHYGYLVDGAWYVPADEGSVVPDEWGRMSAILVIEGVN